MNIFTRAFWSYAGERAIKTVAQTAISALAIGGITGVLDVAWIPLASGVALAGIISVLTSVLSYTPAAIVTHASVLVATAPTAEVTTPTVPLEGA